MFVYRGASCVNLDKVNHFQLDFHARRKKLDDGMIKFYFDHYYYDKDTGITEQHCTTFFFDTVRDANKAMSVINDCIQQGLTICFLNNEELI